MFKVIVAVLVLAGLGLLAAYRLGGVSSFDPTEQGREAQAAIQPGMKWTGVVDVAGEPKHYRVMVTHVKRDPILGDLEEVKPGGRRSFDTEILKQEIADGNVPDGFIFDYFFSAQVAFAVWFDGNGVVEEIVNTRTMADWLDTRDGG